MLVDASRGLGFYFAPHAGAGCAKNLSMKGGAAKGFKKRMNEMCLFHVPCPDWNHDTFQHKV